MQNSLKNIKIWGTLAGFAIVVGAGLGIAASQGVFSQTRNESLAPPETQVKAFVENFGEHMNDVSLLSPDATSAIQEEYGPFASADLIAKWKGDPESAPGRLTSSPWPALLSVESVTKTGSSTYQVDAHIVLQTSKEEVSTSTNEVAGTIPVVLTVEEKNSPEALKLSDRFEITHFQKGDGTSGTASSSQTSSSNGSITRTSEGLTAVATYEGNETWKYTVTGYYKTPCYKLDPNVRVAESYPEQVTLEIDVTGPPMGVMCAQVIAPRHLMGTYHASSDASFSFIVVPEPGETGGHPDKPVSSSGTPILKSMSPTSGGVGTRVALTGSGFLDAKWVHFGSGVIPPDDVYIASDEEIIFRVPNTIAFICQFSEPRCMLASAPLKPGEYAVSVSTERGAPSESQIFTVK